MPLPTRSPAARARRLGSVLAAAALATGGVVVVGAPAEAAKGGSCDGYSVTVGGRTFTGNQKTTIPAAQVGDTISVQGTYNFFTVDAATFAVRHYTHTGVDSPRPDKDPAVDGPTEIFVSKVPQHGDTLNQALSLRLANEGVVLERAGAVQHMKVQAKDCPAGGLFQMEPEPATTYVHQLGAGFRYDGPAGTGRLCFTNGAFSGYESPEVATRVSPLDGAGTTSTWDVTSGGRMGMVTGEDAVEGGCAP
jgi:hypothetical protein